jgi:hypothetical protein
MSVNYIVLFETLLSKAFISTSENEQKTSKSETEMFDNTNPIQTSCTTTKLF